MKQLFIWIVSGIILFCLGETSFAISSSRADDGWKIYTDTQAGFELSYPGSYKVHTGTDTFVKVGGYLLSLVKDDKELGVNFDLSILAEDKTCKEETYYRFDPHLDEPEPYKTWPDTFTISGVPFDWFWFGGCEMGHCIDFAGYRGFVNNKCWIIRFKKYAFREKNVNTPQVSEYSPEEKIEVDKARAIKTNMVINDYFKLLTSLRIMEKKN